MQQRGLSELPVVPIAAQAAMVTGLAMDTAGLTSGRCRVSVMSPDWFVQIF